MLLWSKIRTNVKPFSEGIICLLLLFAWPGVWKALYTFILFPGCDPALVQHWVAYRLPLTASCAIEDWRHYTCEWSGTPGMQWPLQSFWRATRGWSVSFFQVDHLQHQHSAKSYPCSLTDCVPKKHLRLLFIILRAEKCFKTGSVKDS